MVAPGRRSPSSGGSPRVRFPGQENQYQPAGRWAGPLSVEAGLGHVDLVACQGRPGAYHVPFGGHQNEAAVDHLSGRGGGLSVYRMAGGRKPSFKAPFSSANRPDFVRPRSGFEDHEGENGKQLASLRLLSLGLPVVWAKKMLDISGKIFDHLRMMDSVNRLFNRSYKNHFITFDNNYGRVEL